MLIVWNGNVCWFRCRWNRERENDEMEVVMFDTSSRTGCEGDITRSV